MLAAGWGGIGRRATTARVVCFEERCTTRSCKAPHRSYAARVTPPQEFILLLNGWFPDHGQGATIPSLADLEILGLPDEIAETLQDFIDSGDDPSAVIITFFYLLTKSKAGRNLDRHTRRIILKEFKAIRPEAKLVETLLQRLEAVAPTGWDLSGVDSSVEGIQQKHGA